MTSREPPDTSASQESAPAGQNTGSIATRAIGTAALILMAANLSSSALGYVRIAVIDAVFGGQRAADAFIAASLIPQMFYDLTIGAAISAALIPTFTEIYDRSGKEQLARTAGSVLGLAWIALAIITGVLVFAAEPLTSVILAHSSGGRHTAGVADAIRIVRVIVPTLFFLGTSAVLLSSLYAVRRFVAAAFSSGVYHLGVIAGALALARPLGILALPLGAVAGSVGQVLVQIPSVMRWIGRPQIRVQLTPEVRKILRLYAPVAAGLVVSIVGQIIDIGFKWQLGKGAVLSMANATTLTQFPIGIAVAGLSFAILPSISADAAFGRMEQFKATLTAGMRLVLFLTIPATVGYVILATPISALLFQHVHYGPKGTARTSLALIGYAIQIPFVGIDQLMIFSFYARRDTVTPMLVGILGVGIYVASALTLMPRLHILGLALANSIQNSLHGVILLSILLVTIGSLRGTGLLRGIARTCVAAGVMALGGLTTMVGLAALLPAGHLSTRAAEVLLPIIIGLALYAGVAGLLRSEELRLLLDIARRQRPVASPPPL